MEPTWAIVELFGHSRIAGLVSEETIGGSAFIRVDVPAVDGRAAFTKFFGGAAIYALTPTDKQTATYAVSKFQSRPVDAWLLPAPPAIPYPDDEENDDGDDEDDEFQDFAPYPAEDDPYDSRRSKMVDGDDDDDILSIMRRNRLQEEPEVCDSADQFSDWDDEANRLTFNQL